MEDYITQGGTPVGIVGADSQAGKTCGSKTQVQGTLVNHNDEGEPLFTFERKGGQESLDDEGKRSLAAETGTLVALLARASRHASDFGEGPTKINADIMRGDLPSQVGTF